jgi:aspartyl-tRNA(Asn)/glutamyl-tRNA(Gln) amidotransferase subunit B
MFFDRLEPVIGLEIHAQLNTKSKLFCPCPNTGDTAAICPICVGHPGTLPQLNGAALALAVRMALALQCKVNDPVFFDRKHYFYPDLPKGYQISQYDVPIGVEGKLVVEVPGSEAFTVRFERIHLEEDAAKNTHAQGATRVDYARAGAPLVEMVTRPDLHSADEAKRFLQELQRLLRFTKVSLADMEKGHMRCDANISLRPLRNDGSLPTDSFYPKTEVKNMNSFRAVERAITFELERQAALWKAGTPPEHTTTRAWNAEAQETVPMRSKEAAADYRYMREPDVPPVATAAAAAREQAMAACTPSAARERLVRHYAVAPAAAWVLADTPASAQATEQALDEALAWLTARTQATDATAREQFGAALGKLAGTWLATKWRGVCEALAQDPADTNPALAARLGALLGLLANSELAPAAALPVLEAVARTQGDPEVIARELGLLGAAHTTADLSNLIAQVLADFPTQLAEYRAGKEALLPFFIGQAMKRSKGMADAQAVREALLAALK